ncbi:hypothetical protein ACFZCY_13910 [Streptomyces sp. NPDC007983]|uniref:hypothetical protein n=1 Tax=Streptomyces sp. NPDC007983 TaxID=3364800 RepID=UPI0036E0778A
MRKLSGIESDLFRAYQEIESAVQLQSQYANLGELGMEFRERPALFTGLPGWQDIILSQDLCQNTPRVTEIKAYWSTVAPLPKLQGEFCVGDVFTDLIQPPPEPLWEGSPPEDGTFFPSIRVVDDAPVAGTGHWAGIRILPRTDPLEMWFYDPQLVRIPEADKSYFRIHLTYPEYLRNLAITKGTLGWQYLFTDAVPLNSPGLRETSVRLQNMMEIMPALFPDWEYRPIFERLEARL